MAKRGRKRIEIDWKQFEGLCAIQATLAEMAFFFNCSEDTVQSAVKRHYKEKFSVVFAEKRLPGFILLRRTIWQMALSGKPTMVIFLAKRYLRMSDYGLVEPPEQSVQDKQRPDSPRLTDEEYDRLNRILDAAGPGKLPPAPRAHKTVAGARANLLNDSEGDNKPLPASPQEGSAMSETISRFAADPSIEESQSPAPPDPPPEES